MTQVSLPGTAGFLGTLLSSLRGPVSGGSSSGGGGVGGGGGVCVCVCVRARVCVRAHMCVAY